MSCVFPILIFKNLIVLSAKKYFTAGGNGFSVKKISQYLHNSHRRIFSFGAMMP